MTEHGLISFMKDSKHFTKKEVLTSVTTSQKIVILFQCYTYADNTTS